MRLVFLGTPDVAVPSLQLLAAADDVEVALVVTNPDRPKGRRGTPQPPPVKQAALALGLDVAQPADREQLAAALAEAEPDIAAVVAYGMLLPDDILRMSTHGFVNLHFSLLPRWRGAAPVQHAIRSGDTHTGVTTFVIDSGMDTGPIIDQVDVGIGPGETSGELLERLAELGAPVLADSLRALVDGRQPTPQLDDGIALAPKIVPDDVRIDFARPASEIVNLVRSANPAPGAHTTYEGDRFKVHRASMSPAATEGAEPGQLIEFGHDGLVVACGDGAVLLTEVQPSGKPRMDAGAWANGSQPVPTTVFGQ